MEGDSGTRRPAGSPEAGADFEEFYAAAFDPLCIQLFANTGDLAEAQDVVQEAFCRALTRWPTVCTYDDPVAWVRRVAWNLATSRWRRIRVAMRAAHRYQPAPAVLAEPSLDRLDLIAALATLPQRQRQAVVLHYLADISITEIATLTGAAEGTVKSWLHRARTALATRLIQVPAAGEVTKDASKGVGRA